MDERLNKSLSDIIADTDRRRDNRDRRGSGSGAIRRNGAQSSRREGRNDNPYEYSRRRERKEGSRGSLTVDNPPTYDCAIKFLLNNSLAGSFIGNAGFAVQDMIEITGASHHIANAGTPYPGHPERCLFIYGSENAVALAQALTWELIGQQTYAAAEGIRTLVWNPAAAKASPGEYDSVEVSCKLAIPAAAAGRVIGRGGNVFRKMSEDCSVEASMDDVADAQLLQERIITLDGTVAGCMNFTSMLLAKLCEVPDGCQYVHSVCVYPRSLYPNGGGGGSSVTGSSGGRARSSERGDRDGGGRDVGRLSNSRSSDRNGA
jgi:hypothetical protein